MPGIGVIKETMHTDIRTLHGIALFYVECALSVIKYVCKCVLSGVDSNTISDLHGNRAI